MPGNGPRIYLDANVLLAYVGGEEGRADIVFAVLDLSRKGEIETLTSTLSIAEVAYGAIERDAGLTTAGEAAIDKLWTPASPITLVDVSEPLARAARTLIRTARDKKLSLRSVDALHLASAQMYGCERIFTYEDNARRARWSELTGLPVEEPVVAQGQLL